MRPVMMLVRGLVEAQALRWVQRRFGGRAVMALGLLRLIAARRK